MFPGNRNRKSSPNGNLRFTIKISAFRPKKINQSINQSILYFSVEHNVTEYIGEHKNTHIKIYKNRTAKTTVLEQKSKS